MRLNLLKIRTDWLLGKTCNTTLENRSDILKAQHNERVDGDGGGGANKNVNITNTPHALTLNKGSRVLL